MYSRLRGVPLFLCMHLKLLTRESMSRVFMEWIIGAVGIKYSILMWRILNISLSLLTLFFRAGASKMIGDLLFQLEFVYLTKWTTTDLEKSLKHDFVVKESFWEGKGCWTFLQIHSLWLTILLWKFVILRNIYLYSSQGFYFEMENWTKTVLVFIQSHLRFYTFGCYFSCVWIVYIDAPTFLIKFNLPFTFPLLPSVCISHVSHYESSLSARLLSFFLSHIRLVF